MHLLRKLLYSSLPLLLTGITLHAQTVESQLMKPVLRCEDVRQNALEAIPRIYREQPIDSVIRAISFWEDKCKNSEELQRIKILVAIKNRHFSELLYDSNIIHHIDRFKEVKDLNSSSPPGWWYSYHPEDLKLLIAYNTFTKELARSLLPVVDTSKLESYFCYLYADTGNTKKILDKSTFKNTSLVKYYSEFQAAQRKQGGVHIALISGIWIPTGAATLLGNHPYIGLEYGGRDDKNRLVFTMSFKFIKSQNTYQIKRRDQLYDTDHFFGGYLGLEYGRKIVGNNTHLLEATLGAGVDGFDVYNSSNENSDQMKPVSILSYNFNGGAQYSFFYNKSKTDFFGLQVKYNVTNYRNKGGTDITGNPITIGLVWGGGRSRGYYGSRQPQY
ncbi:MAG: hypothetical protein J7621_05390 [Niastella sp.]|nr:hypothetical protein [Niastella sp.]